ncbi:hypothetical protein LWI28_025808 [Acer negundo]|uniref:BURP domain-containing protein n=1 Tax=Acer negundo TaxID=4023 RepID=A0AAD5JB44_ACENE|nr:hypothetical protein LWI28_025808 [Acer negundo]
MGSRFSLFVTFLTLLVASHSALSPELYWKSVLPNTPMPKASQIFYTLVDLVEDKNTAVDVGKGGVNVDAWKAIFKNDVKISYKNAASENQLHDVQNTAIFFVEKDLHPGTKMNLQFTENLNEATFLPRQVAKSNPFSSNQMPEILNRFSVKPGSLEADIMQNTIKVCEEAGIKGEEKYCATSLESMIDFSTSKLGKKVQAISTEVQKRTQLQEYTIAAGIEQMTDNKSVVCHKQNYAYAVFYCHAMQTTRAYVVPLEGTDGTKAKAVAVCHTDTSEWNPKHLAFQVLKVNPGTVPICHFLAEDQIVWVANKKPEE